MARADLLLELVRAGAGGDQALFRKSLEALVAEERAKQHHVLADRLASHLVRNGTSPSPLLSAAKGGGASDLVAEIVPRRRLEDLVLPASVVGACKELIEEQDRADLLRAHGLEPRHRVLLAGPPGNGKTSVAEAIGSELAWPLLVVRYESLIASYLGETAVRLARLFEHARARQCVLFFDEFDVVGKERGDPHETGEIKRAVSSLLLQVDALPSYVVVITATNHGELLDKAVWRRFQIRLDLPAPGPAEIEEWLRRFEAKSGLKLKSEPAAMARRLRLTSFSDLEQFATDVQRRYVLALPGADVGRIIEERLAQWEQHANPGPQGGDSQWPNVHC